MHLDASSDYQTICVFVAITRNVLLTNGTQKNRQNKCSIDRENIIPFSPLYHVPIHAYVCICFHNELLLQSIPT
jgi:hypothetical protein